MSKSKTVTVTVHRSSKTGQFVTEQEAKRKPATTETEKIKKRSN